MTPLVITGLAVVYIALFFAFLSLPRWWGASYCRHNLWKLRDEFVDDLIAGLMPPDHAAVRSMLGRIDYSVRRTRPIGMVDVFLTERYVLRHLPDGIDDEYLAEPTTEGLSTAQQERLDYFRSKSITLLAGSLITSSWAGFSIVLWMFVKGRRQVTAKDAVVMATKTPLGRRTRAAACVVTSVGPKARGSSRFARA